MSKLYRAVKAKKLAALGLHPGQDILLWVLAQAEDGWIVSQLAERMGVESPTVTRSLNRMKDIDAFRRETIASDRRQVRIVLTAHGRSLVGAIEAVWAELASDCFGPLSDAEREPVLQALERANERLLGLVDAEVLARD